MKILFPPVASVLNANKDDRFSTNVRIRKILIPKQYMVHKDELTVKRKMSTTKEKEKNVRYQYHSTQEIKKEKSSKGKIVSPKEKHTFLEGKGMNTSRKKYLQGLLSLLLSHLDKGGMCCIIRNFLKSSPELKKEVCRDLDL